ncbi:uncharacterized protein J8A68_002999 [[Candida] subhashii]|uniref:Uncharacterized protein n=1 Tax=[Candida] subhashii TaxID=561895 RepID=A0A8J5UN64_9ASCO|nr:uncharacterized protein J8A68_002999 [[Candida] subhashii]KAG7663452.1 hypothetical protein J8A68_002999 [[Candida] subhashii]
MADEIELTTYKTPEIDVYKNERFHMVPRARLEAIATTAGVTGMMKGFFEGLKTSSVRYLVENGHRLPKTVGGWYFYHKKKNYVMLVESTKVAIKQSLKYSGVITGFFGLEYLFDRSRNNTIDFLNTTVAAMLVSTFYVGYNQLSIVQSRKMIMKGTALGLVLGLLQDSLIYSRGGRVWYLQRLGIQPVSTEPVSQLEA